MSFNQGDRENEMKIGDRKVWKNEMKKYSRNELKNEMKRKVLKIEIKKINS